MIIPLSDIDRYVNVVDRFQSLVSVTFKPDEFLEVSMRGSIGLRMIRDFGQLYEECKRKRAQQFRAMIVFVQKHCQLFPNLLQEADCPPDCNWPDRQQCPLRRLMSN